MVGILVCFAFGKALSHFFSLAGLRIISTGKKEMTGRYRPLGSLRTGTILFVIVI